jgi:hypothetical protein
MTKPIERARLIELLNRCWMTHDAMWFHHCSKEFGISDANRINKAAIRSLAPIEVGRIRMYLGMDKERVGGFDEFKSFFCGASELCIPDFMNVTMNFPRDCVLRWDFKPKACFAYKGMTRIGAINEYECGVIYRLECWIECLGVRYETSPKIGRCLMLEAETCSGEFNLRF